MRFAAAAVVVLYHLTFWIGRGPTSEPFRLAQGQFHFPTIVSVSQLGWIGVEIFFVLSGFVISYSSQKASPSSFLGGRIARLVPAAWICSTLTILFVFYAGQEAPKVVALRWLRTMLFCPVGRYSDGAFWTLPIEVAFYALIYLKLKFASKLTLEQLAGGLALWSGLFWLVCLLIGPAAVGLRDARISALVLLTHGGEFGLGMALSLLLNDRVTRTRLAIAAVCVLAAAAETVTSAIGKRVEAATPYSPILPLAIWLVAVALIILSVVGNKAVAARLGRFSKPIRILGLATYPLYLVHQNAGAVLMGALRRFGVNPALCAIIAMAMALLTAILIVEFLEPPARSLLKRITGAPILSFLFSEKSLAARAAPAEVNLG